MNSRGSLTAPRVLPIHFIAQQIPPKRAIVQKRLPARLLTCSTNHSTITNFTSCIRQAAVSQSEVLDSSRENSRQRPRRIAVILCVNPRGEGRGEDAPQPYEELLLHSPRMGLQRIGEPQLRK